MTSYVVSRRVEECCGEAVQVHVPAGGVHGAPSWAVAAVGAGDKTGDRPSDPGSEETTMAYDEGLAARIREVLADTADVTEQKMFGGLAFMIRGHMVCGVVHDDLMLRLGPEGAAAALGQPHVRPMDFTGRPMSSMVYIDRVGVAGESLDVWVKAAGAHADQLPPKVKKATRAGRARG